MRIIPIRVIPSARLVRSCSTRAHTGVRTAALTLAAAVTLAACGGSGSSTDTDGDATTTTTEPVVGRVLTVAASLFPIEEVVTRVGGANVDLIALTPPGQDAHDRELTAKQLDELSGADAVFYLGEDFQPSVEKAIGSLADSVSTVDLLETVTLIEADKKDKDQSKKSDDGHDHDHAHGEHDPHIWLDPANMAAITRQVSRTLGELEPAAATKFAANADAYIAELDRLGADIDTSLATCSSRVLVTAHAAFAYLAKRAKLETHSISGLNPNDEPSAKQLEELKDLVRDEGVSTVFYETLLPGNIARTIADSTGARTDLLDPIESISAADAAAGETYLSIQRANLERLVTGLGCS